MIRPRLLILSFSEIESDARVRRQVELFAEEYEVTTCGFGGRLREDVRHIQLPLQDAQKITPLPALFLRAKLFGIALQLSPLYRAVRRALSGMQFEAVIANDLAEIVAATRVAKTAKIHADLHEYWPGLHDNVAQWNTIRRPYYVWMLQRFVANTASHTTVNGAIAARYSEEFGFECEVVTNSGLHLQLEPQPVAKTIKLVHSGGVNPDRRIDVMMRAVAASSNDVTLDLYLMGEGSAPRRELEALAEELGPRITILPPVPQQDLVRVLNQYDVGIHILAPVCTNNALALPNKFFDFVQARLAVVAGPTQAMVDILEKHELGFTTASFEQEDVTATLDALTLESVQAAKWRAHAAAEALSSAHQVQVWKRAIDRIVAGTSTTPAPGEPGEPLQG